MSQPPQTPQPGTDPLGFAQSCGNAWLAEARQLRSVEVPSRNAHPESFFQAMVEARGNQDRLEEIYTSALALWGGYRRRADELAQAADEAWNRAADQAMRSGARRGHEYEGPRERYATFELAILKERRDARTWERAADLAKDTVDRLKIMYQGLGDVQRAMTTALSYHATKSRLSE